MKTSDKALHLLKAWEGCVLHTYPDVAGKQTIGVGHLLTREEQVGGKFHDGITEAEALELLVHDIAPAENAVACSVKVPLEQHQFDALVCFTFNVGGGAFRGSTLCRLLNEGQYDAVPGELMKWTKAGGKRSKGLVNRRTNEIRLWKGEI